MPTSISRIDSSPVGELYVTSVPDAGAARGQARQMFTSIAEVLRDAGARIVQERVFFAPVAGEAIVPARKDAYRSLDDGVSPALLSVSEGAGGPVAGAQVHAVIGADPEPVELDGRSCGRVVRCGSSAFLAVSALSASGGSSPRDQARAMLEQAERAVAAGGGSLASVIRTWMWIGGILDWYAEFNDVRNEFFRERGLTGPSGCHLPASTGIGVAPAGGGACAMDLVAAIGAEDAIEHHLAAGEQGSAFDYGSAFSRASRGPTPAGSTVYVSGTAAIDRRGRTECVDDAAGQIEKTVAHVRAVLRDMGCAHEDVVQAAVYCKTPEVESIFRERWADLPWPQLVMIADVCREDLLFEAEVTARAGR